MMVACTWVVEVEFVIHRKPWMHFRGHLTGITDEMNVEYERKRSQR